MFQEKVPRHLTERTGKHFCISCLRETPSEEYFANDHVCRECAARSEAFPLAATPEAKEEADAPSGGAEPEE